MTNEASSDETASEPAETAPTVGAGARAPTDHPKTASDIASIYADQADTMERMRWLDRKLTGRYRRRQFGDAAGRVLDVACGGGTNFAFLPVSTDLVGVDISPEMLAAARRELDRLDRDGELVRMDAQQLAYPDDSFDTVISALSTCTFPDPVAALREMQRVCKPDGRILLLEHGRSDVGPIDRFLDWRAEAHYEKHGCRWNQDPVELVRDAGLPLIDVHEHVLGIITRIEASPVAVR
ncbi:class I SAM-dependent methyltransferase [Halovivax limisalsi]|uniref:class I SAM-dependent methyltransferase n=1 Tax=Halovivax limisalsi TaxID=1453760 RepID=UPI001FFC84D7|nr:methyltransferase domain-containing protein [Halovivax limisalsi]